MTELEGLEALIGRWDIDPDHTNLGFTARHMMVTQVRGAFSECQGWFEVQESLQVVGDIRIAATTITTGTPERDDHLRTNDFLDVVKYPELRFVPGELTTVSPDKARLEGDLTVKDRTKPVTLDLEVFGYVPMDDKNLRRISFGARGLIDRREFNVMWNRALEHGGILVGNEVGIDLQVTATSPPSVRTASGMSS